MLTWEPESETQAVADARAKDTIIGVVVGVGIVAAGLVAHTLQVWACAS